MLKRERLTAIFTLLVATVQLAGVAVVPSANLNASAAEYYCCCVGECHCTADCCRHAPEAGSDASPPSPAFEAGTTFLESPVRCAVFTGTLNRLPDPPRALATSTRRQRVAPPAGQFRTLTTAPCAVGTRTILRASTPRAPPFSVVTA